MRLDAYLFPDTHVVAVEEEGVVGFVVRGGTMAAEGGGQAVAQTEAGERRLGAGVVWLERANLDDEGSIADKEVEGEAGGQRRIKRLSPG